MKKIILLLLLSSCSLAPNYQRPSADIKDNWSQNLIDAKEIALDENQEKDARSLDWKSFFQNQELQEIIEIALQNNSDLKIAALNIKSAQEFYNIKQNDFLPKLNADASFNRQRITRNSSNFGFSGRDILQQQYYAGLSTSFELDLFGKIESLRRGALQDFLAKVETKNALKISLIAQTANLYLQLVADNEKLELQKKLVENEEKNYELQEKIFANGIISRIDLSNAQMQLQEEKSKLAAFSSLVEKDKNQLILLMNAKDDEKIKIIKQKDLKFAKNSLKNLSSQVLLLRPDVMAAEYQLKAANANIGAARAAFFPSISLTSNYGFASAKFSNLFSTGSKGSWSFHPTISAPIFNAMANVSNLKISKIDKEIAVENYQKALKTAFKEVADELAIKKNIKDQFDSQNAATEASELSYKLSSAKYQHGISSLSELLANEKNMIKIKQQDAQIKQEYFVNFVNLYKVLGGGL